MTEIYTKLNPEDEDEDDNEDDYSSNDDFRFINFIIKFKINIFKKNIVKLIIQLTQK